jgi:hypothetical protein
MLPKGQGLRVMLLEGDGPSSTLVNRPQAELPALKLKCSKVLKVFMIDFIPLKMISFGPYYV